MQDIRKIIAENICLLRTSAGMTQAGLAEILNYTDKAVSKWECGEAIPDVTVLKQIADHFGVTVDYLLRSDHSPSEGPANKQAETAAKNRLIITGICAISVFAFATVAFVAMLLLAVASPPPWMCFVYAVPVCSVLILVFNSVWGIRRLNFLIVSVLLWSVLCAVYLSILTILTLNLWLIFLVGAPAQLVILFVPGLKPVRKKPEKG